MTASRTITTGCMFKVPTRSGLRFGGRVAFVREIRENVIVVGLKDGLGLRRAFHYCRASLEAAGFEVAR